MATRRAPSAWRALNACLPVLEDGRHVRFSFLPEVRDPDTLIRSEGRNAFRARMPSKAQHMTDYLFRTVRGKPPEPRWEGKGPSGHPGAAAD